MVLLGVFRNQLLCTLVLLIHYARSLLINEACAFVAVWALSELALWVVIRDIRHLLAHTVIHHHAARNASGLLHIVERASANRAEEQLLCRTTAHKRANLVEERLFGVAHTFFRHSHIHAQRLAAWHNRNLHQRSCMFEQPDSGGVSSLVNGSFVHILASHQHRLVFQAQRHLIDSLVEVSHRHSLAVLACGEDCRLVAHVGNLRTAHTWGLASQLCQIHSLIHLHLLQMHLKDSLTVGECRECDMHLAVETTRTQERVVENILAVGGSQHYHAACAINTVHFGEQLVERLVVFAVETLVAALGAHGIDFVDKYHARSLLLRLGKEFAHTRCAHAHKLLHKLRTRAREERHISLASHCLCQHRLTGAWRAHEQRTLRHSAAQTAIFLRILEEIHNLGHFLLSLFHASHVGELNRAHIALLVFQSLTDIVDSSHEVVAAHSLGIFGGGLQGGIVAHLGNVGTAEARGDFRQVLHIHIFAHLHIFQIEVEDFGTLFQIRLSHIDMAVETARAQ